MGNYPSETDDSTCVERHSFFYTDSDEVEQTKYLMAAQKGPITPSSRMTNEAEGKLDSPPMRVTAKGKG